MSDMKAETCARALWSWIRQQGAPVEIRSDRGANLNISEKCREIQIPTFFMILRVYDLLVYILSSDFRHICSSKLSIKMADVADKKVLETAKFQKMDNLSILKMFGRLPTEILRSERCKSL